MLKMKQKDIGFFEEDLPFDIKDFLGLEAEIESYELLPLKDRYENDCLFQLETEKRMGNFDYLRPSFCHIIDGFIEFGKINTASKELDSAFKEIKDIKSYNNIEIVHLLYLKIKILFNNNQIDQTFEVFRQILEILKRSLKNNHPIFPIFYCLMAEHFLKVCDYNNALFLYKSSLFAFIRVFGKNAPILADVYCNLAKIYCQLGDFDEEYANYQSALFLYEICKFENKRYFYDISWKMSNLCKMKGLIKESIQFGLSCVEVLETDAKSFLEELIDCYLLIIEQTFNLNDFSSGILFCDDCSRLLNEMEKNSYNTYRKLFEWGLKAYFSRSSHDKQEFFKKIATKMQENLDKENELYKNDEKYMQMIILKALDALANETKLFEKFSQFISNHFENIFKNKDSINLMNINNDRINDTGSKVQEIIHSLEILENLLIVIPLQKFLNFFD